MIEMIYIYTLPVHQTFLYGVLDSIKNMKVTPIDRIDNIGYYIRV